MPSISASQKHNDQPQLYQEYQSNVYRNTQNPSDRTKSRLKLQGNTLQRLKQNELEEGQLTRAQKDVIVKLNSFHQRNHAKVLHANTKVGQSADNIDESQVQRNFYLQDINSIVQIFNDTLALTIKNKQTVHQQQQTQQIKKYFYRLQISCSKADLQDQQYLRSKEFMSLFRSKAYQQLNNVLLPKQLSVAAQLGQKKQYTYRYWVECSGNNHVLIKNIIKRRGWLQLNSDYDGSTRDQDNNESVNQLEPRKQKTNLIWTQMRRAKIIKDLDSDQIYNHLYGINCIVTKTGLCRTLQSYYAQQGKNVWECIPETHVIDLSLGEKEKCLKRFANAFNNDIWIIKPGEGTNRGHGIQIQNDLEKILNIINGEYSSHYKTVILQKYISNPYLVNKRKFDIRVFALLTWQGEAHVLRGYYFQEGYLRTSSREFNIKKIDSKYIHLTNDAVQMKCQDYGKFESGNKLSYDDFQKMLFKQNKVSFNDTLLLKMKQRVTETFEAASNSLVGQVREDYNAFEILGFDFMIDTDLNLTLIEVNTNPCLETQSCLLLQRLIPQLLDQTMKIAVDPFLRPSEQQYGSQQDMGLSEIKYECIFESKQ